MQKKSIICVVLAALMLAMLSATAYAQTDTVKILTPSNSNGDLGIWSNNCWIGQFPITLNPETNSATTGEAYCLTSNGYLNVGTSYQATTEQVPDTQTWREISYILSWYTPTDNNQAAANQVAIWMLLGQNPPYANFVLDSSITTQATNLVNAANGMNVARQGDQLKWISPSSGTTVSTSANPGQTVTFQVQLTNSTGQGRANVRIDFNATIIPSSGSSSPLNSTYISPTQAFTNSNGVAQVSVTVPVNVQAGSNIQVNASTQSVWPQEYLDLTNQTPTAQNILGTSQIDLTVSTNLNISANIFVLPESAYGAFAAILSFAAAFAIYYKFKPQIKR